MRNSTIDIEFDFRDFALPSDATGKRLATMTNSKLERNIQFAVANTLTGAAFEVRRAMQKHLQRRLNIKKNFLPKSVVVNKATKVKLYSEVGFLERAWIAPFLEDGGTKRPNSGQTIAVPQDARRGKRGNVTKSQRPRNVLRRDDTFIAEINGTLGIWQRAGRRGNQLRLLYNLEYTVDYDSNQIDFYGVAYKVASHYFKKNIAKNISRAIETSR